MSGWTSSAGLAIHDLVPERLRRRWVAEGYCPDRDLYSLFTGQARSRPHQAAVIDDEGSMTYSELHRAVRALAGSLSAAGLGTQDVIGVQVQDGRHAVVAELAVAAAGSVCLPIPPGRGESDLATLLGGARAAAVIVDSASPISLVRERIQYLPAVFVLPCDGTDPTSLPVPDPEAPARILVSSGSESTPKMVAYSHNAIAGGRANYIRAVHGDTSGIRDLLLVSLASSYGSFGAAVTLCCLGGTLILCGRFDPARALQAIGKHRPTHVFGVPTMLRRMAMLSPSHDEDLSSVRAMVSSGDVLHQSTVDLCRRRFGVDVVSVYGSADGVNTHTREPELGTGFPDPAVTDIQVRGDEVIARGPMTPLCYVGAPQLDARYRLPGGWVRTGDHGRIDDDGRLHLLGRIKRVIIRGGHTISPAEVERELSTHPEIAEVACVPIPDADLGERLCACVAPRPGRAVPSLAALAEFLSQRGLEPRKLPERLAVFSELPLGHTGKVCHRTLSQLARQSQQ
ncbi:class I adenylate-forming enzyme family protein [Amycolatopsis sp. cg5]|uniref:class I adenylate-forming enzyme family protein n=1 Tax=Amycolatopsis sp. cg5 TaxID=3238802 RepID=UPI003524CF3A